MGYDVSNDSYIDPKTKVLKNKIGAKTQAALDKAEAEITYVIIATLTQGSDVRKLKFNSNLLCDVHEEIFGDIYTWAGKIRTQNIGKDDALFAHADYIPVALQTLSEELEADDQQGFLNRDEFVNRLTHYYSEYNAIHPFREGNGRAIRTFLRLFALKHGYDIEWANMEPKLNIEASQQSFNSEPILLREMLDSLTTEIDQGLDLA